MAKVDTQSIPSEERIRYKRALQISTLHKTTTYVRTRYPWRLPHMQGGAADETPAQRAQRAKFTLVKNKYATLSAAQKLRWKDANPEYKSFLFGYDFFIMEGLSGGGPPDFAQMIKTIQVQTAEVPKDANKTFTLVTPVDATRTVVMIAGSARKLPHAYRGSGSVATGGAKLNIGDTVLPIRCTVELDGASHLSIAPGQSVPIHPVLTDLGTTQLDITWSVTPDVAAVIGFEIVQHFEGVILPILVSVSNTEVVVKWAELAATAADVSITVIEYL